MKKLLGLTLCALGAISLTSCGTSVDKQTFVEEANKVEEHQYSSATISYSRKSVLKGFNALYGSDDYDGSESTSGKMEFTFGANGWTSTSESDEDDIGYIASYLDLNVKDALSDMGAEEEANTKFFINPFKIVYGVSEDGEEDGAAMSITEKAEITFNKYGYVTALVNSMSYTMKSKNLEGKEVKASQSEKLSVTISYKD